MTFRPGAMIGARYRLVSRIAGGGMGEVWQADDTVLERTVAIKVLRQELADDPTFLARFRDEARHTAALSHPGIAAVHDYGETEDDGRVVAWMVMEYVEGEPLSRRIKRDGPLPPAQVLDVVSQTALALQAAHEAGVVHRDVKPANLLVRPDGVVKVTDFGIARATGAASLTRTGTMVGTAQYLSPEQATGGQASPASDVYALGVVAYEALTARRPFDGDSQISVALAHANEPVPPLPSGVPDPVRDLVDRLLAKEPGDRPQPAAEVAAEALRARALLVGSDLATKAAPESAAEPAGAPVAAGGTRVLTAPVLAGESTPPSGRRLPWPHWRDYPRAPSAVALGSLLLLVALLAYACAAADAGSTPEPKPTPAATPATVTVDPAQYVGKPYATVAGALSALGLAPVRHDQVAAGTPGTVSSVAPTGAVHRGATITVTVIAAPPPPPPGDNGDNGPGGKGGHGKGKDH